MKEHPIIFNTEMIKAILEGRKTMTRRVIKPQPEEHRWKNLYGYRFIFKLHNTGNNLQVRFAHRLHGQEDGVQWAKSPYGQAGDRLWVRETHARFHNEILTPVHYFANGPMPTVDERHDAGLIKKYPSIHMPRWASRINLEITNIRVERVQDIDEEGALTEGVVLKEREVFYQPGFVKLWDSINAKRGYGWDTNPWVWVIEFKRI